MIDLSGKTAIVTGASRGIGAATARAFSERGANVVLAARSEGEIAKIANELENAIALPCDVAKEDDVKALIDETISTFGKLDILVNNAGVLDPVERLADTNVSAWDKIIDINVKGVYYGVRYALPLMKSNGGGTIINIGSGAATSALEGWSAYCTSKAAVHHLTHCIHKEEAENNIRALIMSPGTVATEMQVIIRDSGVNPVSQIPWEDHITPQAAAAVLVWMCTSAADDYLGQTVAMRGVELRQIEDQV